MTKCNWNTASKKLKDSRCSNSNSKSKVLSKIKYWSLLLITPNWKQDAVIPIFCGECIHATASRLLWSSQTSLTGSSRYGPPSARLVAEESLLWNCSWNQGTWANSWTRWVRNVWQVEWSVNSRDKWLALLLGTSTLWTACSRPSRSGTSISCPAPCKKRTVIYRYFQIPYARLTT